MSRFRSLPRRAAACALAVCTLLGAAAQAQRRPPPAPPLRVGEINSYRAQPAFLEPYRKGWQLAQEEINAQGGVLGRRLQVVSRDDKGSADGALQAARQLRERDGIDVFFGGFLSQAGLALAGYAQRSQAFYLAAAPLTDKLVWQQGNPYTYRVGPSSRMLIAALAPRALGLRKARWALVYPDDEYGRGAAETFKAIMRAFQSGVTFVAEQAVPAARADLRAAARQLADAKPDAFFNALYGADLARFVREGNVQSLFAGRPVVAPLAGLPEYLEPLGADAPAGWLVTGYPRQAIDTDAHRRFEQAYRQRYGAAPQAGSVLGYTTLMALAAGLRKAGSAQPEALAEAFAGLEADSPFGPFQFRRVDHQSTLGVYIGTTAVENGQAVMRPTGYLEGSRLQPLDNEVRRLRPQSAREHEAADAAPATQSPHTQAPATPAGTPPMGPALPAFPAAEETQRAPMLQRDRPLPPRQPQGVLVRPRAAPLH